MGKPDQGSAAAEGARRGDRTTPGPGPAVAADCQWGGSARWCCVCCAVREDLESVSRAVGITAARASQ